MKKLWLTMLMMFLLGTSTWATSLLGVGGYGGGSHNVYVDSIGDFVNIKWKKDYSVKGYCINKIEMFGDGTFVAKNCKYVGSNTTLSSDSQYVTYPVNQFYFLPGNVVCIGKVDFDNNIKSYECVLPNYDGVYSFFDYSKLDYSKLDYSKLDYSKLDYSKLDYSKLDYSKLDYSKLANISYSKGGGGGKQNIYKFAVHNFGGNKYWVIADNIDADKDGKAEGCNEDIPGLSKSNCILYTASLDNKRFVSSVYGGGNSDSTANHSDAANYCSNYGKFGLSWHLPAMKRTNDCDSHSDWWNDESCILYKYGPRDDGNTRTNPTPRLYGIASSRYWTSRQYNSNNRYVRHPQNGNRNRNRRNNNRYVRCLAMAGTELVILRE